MSVQILVGDVRDRLAELPDDHFDCVVTSPPYYRLRDYGVEGQIGLEATPDEHIRVMVEVFERIRRVLKPSGTVWLNYGDCYASTVNGRSAADTKAKGADDRTFRDKPCSTVGGKFKPKDLLMMPNRLAIALHDAGWWVRSEIIWGKSNPMPESITDRPATAHEKIFLLTKRAKYFYNAEASRLPAAASSGPRWASDVESQKGSTRANGNTRPDVPMKAVGGPRRSDKQRGHSRRHAGFNDRWDAMTKDEQSENGRNLRNYEPAPLEVWPIATQPFTAAHFATFPPELALRALVAGCPEGGLVLDPFGGAGTVALVCDRIGLDCTLIELSEDYAEIARKRLEADQGLFARVSVCR